METNKKVKISILVATCNRPEMLRICIQSLLVQKTEIPYEIVGHACYGLYLFKKFLHYNHRPDRFFDCIFVLSPGKYIGGGKCYIQNLVKELQNEMHQTF